MHRKNKSRVKRKLARSKSRAKSAKSRYVVTGGARQDEIVRVTWPKADEVRSVQWQIRRRRSDRPSPTSLMGRFQLLDYQAWLLHQQAGFSELSPESIRFLFPAGVATIQTAELPLSFQKVGDLLFPGVDDPNNRKKRAADAFNRVESEFGRGPLKKKN
jgi:hypothetical protein